MPEKKEHTERQKQKSPFKRISGWNGVIHFSLSQPLSSFLCLSFDQSIILTAIEKGPIGGWREIVFSEETLIAPTGGGEDISHRFFPPHHRSK